MFPIKLHVIFSLYLRLEKLEKRDHISSTRKEKGKCTFVAKSIIEEKPSAKLYLNLVNKPIWSQI